MKIAYRVSHIARSVRHQTLNGVLQASTAPRYAIGDTPLYQRKGFALPLMLALIALGGVLAGATFLMARLDAQLGDNSLRSIRAGEAAESGLSEMVAWWDWTLYDTMSVGGRVLLGPRSLGQGGYTGQVARLSGPLFLIESEGWYQSPGGATPARRLLSSLVRLRQPVPPVTAALAVLDTLLWDDISSINGGDTIPAGWNSQCSAPSSPASGLVAAGDALINLGSCSAPGCLAGSPPFAIDSTLTDTTLTSYGATDYATLAASATRITPGVLSTIGPSVTGSPSSCLLADSLNWGEPLHSGALAACSGYYPIVHAAGDLALTGGRGQGVLLVDGTLTLGGGTTFLGLVVVRGAVRNGPGGGTVMGALLAKDALLSPTLPSSPLRIHYSACVLSVATRGSASAAPLAYRSWAQHY